MCQTRGTPPRTVTEFISWHRGVHPHSDMDYSRLTDSHLQGGLKHCFLPLVCNICEYDYTESNQFGGQRYHNVWYGLSPCGGCSQSVSRPPEYWQRQAQSIYREDGIEDDLSFFLPSRPSERQQIICSTCNRQYRKSLKDIRRLSGCSHCNDENAQRHRRQTREQFISRSQRNHAWRIDGNNGVYPFDYSRIPRRLTNETEVEIGCMLCRDRGIGDWFYLQIAANHSSGYGCRTCAGQESWTEDRLRTFLRESQRHAAIQVVWEDLPNELRKDPKIPLTCIARNHPSSKSLNNLVNHETGGNCRICSHITMGMRRRTTRNRFLERARTRMNNNNDTGLYRYNRIPQIMRMGDTVEIGCIRCENNDENEPYFSQTVSDHLSGCGCPVCNTGGFRLDLPAIVYILRIFIDGVFTHWKIGITNQTAQERADDISQSMIRDCSLNGRAEVVDFWNYETGRKAKDIEDAILEFRDDIFLSEEEYHPPVGQRFEGWTELFPAEFDLQSSISSLIVANP